MTTIDADPCPRCGRAHPLDFRDIPGEPIPFFSNVALCEFASAPVMFEELPHAWYRLDLPMPGKILSPNDSKARNAAWQGRWRNEKAYKQLASDTARLQWIERYSNSPLGSKSPGWIAATIRFDFQHAQVKSGNPKGFDPDNLIAWGKRAVDALVTAGILADDKRIVYWPPTQSYSGITPQLSVYLNGDKT